MRYLLELLPAAAFLAGYFLPQDRSSAMYVAIIATIVATAISLLGWRIVYGEFRKMYLASFALLLVLGGGSILLDDKNLFFWKPTIVYFIFAGILIVSQLLRRSIIKATMSKFVTMPDNLWSRFNTAWVLFLLALGVLNMLVAWNFSEELWVQFKIFGTTGLMFVFMLAQLPFLTKLAVPVEKNLEGD
ncbi:MAG: inner membrane-spanning protein YciB [Candidatus Porifericomitaceae bacterium WSBS_2022_MAG_OTU9]